MALIRFVLVLHGLMMIVLQTYGQATFSPRLFGIGLSASSVQDVGGFALNPSALPLVLDWDFAAATYYPTGESDGAFVFNGFGLAKKFSEDHAGGIQYSPGYQLAFSSVGQLSEQTVTYDEPASIGYGARVSERLTVGMNGNLKREVLSARELSLDTTSLSVSFVESRYQSDIWTADVAGRFEASPALVVTAVGRNIVRIRSGALPAPSDTLSLKWKTALEVSAGLKASEWLNVYGQVSTAGFGSLGIEALPGDGVWLGVSGYAGNDSPAIAAGIGWSYDFLTLEAGYFRFLDESQRTGTVVLSDFDPGSIDHLFLNPYSSDRVSLGARVVFGNVREDFLRIESVRILTGVYPSSSSVHAYRPIGVARVLNISRKPVHARASLYVEQFMDSPTESQPVYLLPGEEKEIPLHAVFNERVMRMTSGILKEGNVYVTAEPAEGHDDKVQAHVLIHGRNAWDGDVQSLRYFVTPDDPDVLRLSRDILLRSKDSLDLYPAELEDYGRARVLFNEFAGKLTYVGDPKQSTDYVQYPAETLRQRTGDCDDMTVCFASLLSSIGISVAFVDVVPPDAPEKSHIYLLFDTGIDPRFGERISTNAKRYVIRKNQQGDDRIWIPIETTKIMNGFDNAWTAGAQEYFDDTTVGLGLAKGWVQIVDIR